jgi:hypothetical protein
MIQTTLEKLNLSKLIGYKTYIIDKALNYILVVEVHKYFMDIITTMTEPGCFKVTGDNAITLVL